MLFTIAPDINQNNKMKKSEAIINNICNLEREAKSLAMDINGSHPRYDEICCQGNCALEEWNEHGDDMIIELRAVEKYMKNVIKMLKIEKSLKPIYG